MTESEAIESKVKLALVIAHEIAPNIGTTILSEDDLVQDGLIGYLKAIREYKPGNVDIDKYATRQMRHSMRDSVRRVLAKKRMPNKPLIDIDDCNIVNNFDLAGTVDATRQIKESLSRGGRRAGSGRKKAEFYGKRSVNYKLSLNPEVIEYMRNHEMPSSRFIAEAILEKMYREIINPY